MFLSLVINKNFDMTEVCLKKIGLLLLPMLALSAAGVCASAAPDAVQILEKSNAVYKNAKSYQAVYQCDMSFGKAGSMSLNIDLKTIPQKKIAMQIKPNGPGTGDLGKRAVGLNMVIADDGQASAAYVGARNSYMRGPHTTDFRPLTSNYAIIIGDLKPKQGVTYKLLPTATVAGRPTYVIESGRAGVTEGMKTVQIFIDQATYLVRQVKMSGTSKGQPISLNTLVKSDQLNMPIPDSVFKFTPPPGAKEQKIPQRVPQQAPKK
jgi:outer membrane lipoprotein-sorting protein